MTSDFTRAGQVTLEARALLLDMDGTLVDSTVVVERTWQVFADRHALDVTAVLAFAHGRPTGETVRRFAPPGTDVLAETRRIVEHEIVDTDGVTATAGAAELLDGLPAGCWALVTSAGQRLAERRMRAAGLPLPAVVVSADDVRKGKPDPEGYLAAADRLRTDPVTAVAVEDTEPGLRAALAAGCTAVSVPPGSVRGHRRVYDVADLTRVSVVPGAGGRLAIRLR